MPENFLRSVCETSDRAVSPQLEEPTPKPDASDRESPDRESLRMLVIGSRQGVTGTIQTLHRLRFAEVREWSPLLPGPNPGEVMSILTRHILLA